MNAKMESSVGLEDVVTTATGVWFNRVDYKYGSEHGPVIVPVFKTGGRQVFLSPVGSTPTRFRQFCQ